MAAGRWAAARRSSEAPIGSGRLDTKMATSRPTPTPSPAAMPIPSTSCSGMPSSSAPSARPTPGLASPGARAGSRLEDRVEAEVRQRSGGEPDGDGPGPADLRALLGEVEAHGADQRTGAEGEHEPDEAARPSARSPQDAADDEGRCGQRPPTERGRHLSGAAGNASGSARYRASA